MLRSSTLVLAVLLALSGAGLAPARAQERGERPVDVEAERRAEFELCFAEGLAAITRRDLAASERLFRRCTELFPDRDAAYYNLACTYSLGEKVDDAVKLLREAFARGSIDLAHMARDMDLDPIRRTPQFRAAISEFESALLRQCSPALSHVPAGEVEGLLVWVHDQGVDPARDLERLRGLLPAWAIVVPQGIPVRGVHAWDDRVEFIVVERLRAFTTEHAARLQKAPRAIVAGEGSAGFMAIGLASHHPDVFGGVLAAGPNLGLAVDDDLSPSGIRAYLIVHREDPAQVASAVQARDHFVNAKSPVVLERYPAAKPLSEDRAVMLRGIAWLGGQRVQLPGAGVEQSF